MLLIGVETCLKCWKELTAVFDGQLCALFGEQLIAPIQQLIHRVEGVQDRILVGSA